MNLKKYQDRIKELMTKFITRIEVEGAMDSTDINRVSENVLIPLLSEIYGHKDLRNLNVSEGPNFPAIDLGDEKTGIAYQITSTANSKKIKDTLQKFVKHKLYEKYGHLIIYILTKKQKTYQERKFDEIIQGKFSFDKKNNIRDYRDLLKEISGFSSVDKLRRVERILEEHFGETEYPRSLDPDTQDDTSEDPLDWLEKVNSLWGEELATIRINREKLRNHLQDFALQGNGVIIGSPGVGKTYLLKELRQSLKSAHIPHLLLPIDQLGDGTDKTLREELSYKGDLIEKLKSVPVPDQKAILLFDTFDAARDEQTRKRFLRLIQRAIQELEGQWNVVVTVRTYDAEKSQEFLGLFGNLDDTHLTQYYSEGILYRHFTIPPLNEDEIRQAFDQIPYLESVYNDGSPEFKQLLANPFNLWLLEKILKSPQDVRALSQIHSEVQLLDVFWRQRVAPVSNKVHCLPILTQIVQQMVKEHLLTVRLDNISDNLGLDQSARAAAWDYLFSNEVLVWIASTGPQIAFSHDILFDYAISILLIEDEPQQLEDFIGEEPSRPLFLRPSLTYFFTRLWYDDDAPEKFWHVFWHLLPINEFLHLRLFARLIPTSVIANETRSIDQLKPLLDELQEGKGIANEATIRLLQSIRALQIERDTLWINFFDQVSAHLHRGSAWDLATLTSEILERAVKNEEEAVIDACGRIGRRLLGWIWQERETGEDDWYDRLGDYWAVPLVAKTYGTNVEESRMLLEKVLALKEGGYFPTDSLTRLAANVDKIWDHDPEFAGLIYRAGITSTRGYNEIACHARLVEHFPDFLRAAPLTAAQAVIQSLNSYTHTFRDPEAGMPVKETFDFRGRRAYFVEDNGYAWNELRIFLAEPTKMANALFEFITELAMSKDSLLDLLLDVFRDYMEVAPFWKRLLKTTMQLPKVFAPHLFELCTARPIQMSREVFRELCTFLETAAPEFTPKQRFHIEKNILEIPGEDKRNRAFLERRRNQLLAQIPLNLLQTDAAREIREEMDHKKDVPLNQPSVNVSSGAEAYTNEKRLQQRGVDTTKPENQELQRLFKPLDKFNSDWLEDVPSEEAIESILPMLEEGYATITENTGADKAMIDSLWYELIACAAILVQVADDPESRLFVLCRQVLLRGATHELPKPTPELDAQYDSSIYSPRPRHKAAHGLLRLTICQSDAEMLDAIEILASDPVPSVRLVTAIELSQAYFTNPERFWCIVDNRATYETNQVVQEGLYVTLAQVVTENEEKTICVMDKLLKRTLLSTETLEPADSCIGLLMWLAIDRENSWALETIEDTFFKDPIRFANFLSCAVYWVMKDYVVPKNLKMPDELAAMQRAIAWLSRAIIVVSSGIVQLCAILKTHRSEEVEQQLHDIYVAINEITMCLHSEVVRESGRSEEPIEKISNELRCCFYNEIKPLMKGIVELGINAESGAMFAPIAHHLIQLLTSFLGCNPKEILHLTEGVARSSKQSGYNFNSLAVEEVVKFVEIVLANHQNEVRDGEGLEDLLKLLDILIEAGWSDAIELVSRLDEVFR